MKRTALVIIASCLFIPYAFTQDEGVIEQKERIDINKGIFLGLGPAVTLGKNIGDYSVGFNFEAGFLKRKNRVLSIGPSLSIVSFAYDPEVTDINGGAYVGFISDPLDPDYWQGYVINLEGGDVTLVSLAFNIKLNFVPVKDNTILSIYGFAKPFLSSAYRSEVFGSSNYYRTTDPNGATNWRLVQSGIEWGPNDYEILQEKSSVTAGIFIGPGIEIAPAKQLSLFFQIPYGYTLPISYISTASYDTSLDSYFNDEFPMTKKGFSSITLQLGISFNF